MHAAATLEPQYYSVGHLALPVMAPPQPALPLDPRMTPHFSYPVRPLLQPSDFFDAPGRARRASRICILIRGLPGSGKSLLARLICNRELKAGGALPRVLSIDDYFMTEIEQDWDKERDSERPSDSTTCSPPGQKRKRTTLVPCYHYDAALAPSHHASLLQALDRTLDTHAHPIVLVDADHATMQQVRAVVEVCARRKYELVVATTLERNSATCAARSIHDRSKEEIDAIAAIWQDGWDLPQLDTLALFRDAQREDEALGAAMPATVLGPPPSTTEQHVEPNVAAAVPHATKRGRYGEILHAGGEMDHGDTTLPALPLTSILRRRVTTNPPASTTTDKATAPPRSNDDAAMTARKKQSPKQVRWVDQVHTGTKLVHVIELENLGPEPDPAAPRQSLTHASFIEHVKHEHAWERAMRKRAIDIHEFLYAEVQTPISDEEIQRLILMRDG